MSAARKKSAKRGVKKSAKKVGKKPSVPVITREEAKLERRSRAAQRLAHVNESLGQTDITALTQAMARELHRVVAEREPETRGRRRGAPRAQATSNASRWVPIGPSVVRRGQADGRPRVTGRVRDIAVDRDGLRAYAATGKAGVWYTDDAGVSWRPVSGWVTSPGRVGGASTDLSCGCLLVSFGDNAGQDYVMVGTGEVVSANVALLTSPAMLEFGGRGVLAGRGPVNKTETETPFEPEHGLALLENVGIYRLVRDPSRTDHAQVAADGDRVLAATTKGLYLGTRATVGGTQRWNWARVTGIDSLGLPAEWPLTDVAWVPVAGNADGRIVIGLLSSGVAWSDTLGASGGWNWVTPLNRDVDNLKVTGRMSFSRLVDDRLYVLIGTLLPAAIDGRWGEPWVYRIPNITRVQASGGPGTAVVVRGAPSNLWGSQQEWDQAIFAERVGSLDRVWLGGSGLTPYTGADFVAAVYCFDVTETGTGAPRLVPAVGVSRVAAPPAGEGANKPGLVGNNIHADVHCIRVVTLPSGARHVWVTSDGGVYLSEQGGRINTFLSRGTGLAAIEAGFVAMHPTSSHFCALGAQDNGVQARVGDVVWEMIQGGDGGGVMFHPTAPQYIVSQYLKGTWFSTPSAKFVGPIDRVIGGKVNNKDRESIASGFYSGCDAIPSATGGGRLALGTNRVWLTDNLGTAAKCSWLVIPAGTTAAVAAADKRSGGSDNVSNRNFGVPGGALGSVVQVRWASPTRMYVVYRRGIVRHDENPAGRWSTRILLAPAQAGAPDTTQIRCTDIAPIPGTDDFYFTTLGDMAVLPAVPVDTCWRCSVPALPAQPTFQATGLRRRLDVAGPPDVLGPLDPAHAVCLHPDNDQVLFVGTIAGVWRGERRADGTHAWDPFMNGLPITSVADVKVWRSAAAGSPLLLRAATQSRGVWETAITGTEPQRTYVRVHDRDDRRWASSPALHPRVGAVASTAPAFASPDVVVRPARRAAADAALPFPLAAGATLGKPHNDSHSLWTFQTAFRWRFPSVRADGLWSDQLADLVRQFRSTEGLGTGDTITAATWNLVVGNTRLDAARALSTNVAHAWAVYESPWQTAGAALVTPTEVDVMELVRPLDSPNDIWRVHSEPSMVDVLLHHRDTRALPPTEAYTALFWRSNLASAPLLAELASTFDVLHAWNGAAAVPTPAGWNRVNVGATAVHRLPTRLDAFMPRAVSIELNLGEIGVGHHVLLVAVCGGSAETPPAPTGLNAASTIEDLTRAWPRMALRMIQCVGPRV